LLVLRSLQQARYDASSARHMGLMSTAYCHFTSPIRRYPDLVVHRALLATLGASEPAEPASDLPGLAVHCSTMERAAEKLERRGDSLAIAHHLDERLAADRQEAFLGEITGLIAAGVFVRFGELYEGFLPVRRLGRDYYDLGPLGVDLIGRTSGHRIKLGDAVWVRVEQIEAPRGRVTQEPVQAETGSGERAPAEPSATARGTTPSRARGRPAKPSPGGRRMRRRR
jgi:ribonuclease R